MGLRAQREVDSVYGIEKGKAQKCIEHFSRYSCNHQDLINGEEESIKIEIVEDFDVCFQTILWKIQRRVF